LSPSERIYGGASQVIEGTRTEDRIDDHVVARDWRAETEDPARRAWRYDTFKLAAFGWSYVDRYREWSRHRRSEKL
jgi:hypothetical protein